MNNSFEFLLSKVRDSILCKYYLPNARLSPKKYDIYGIDIFYDNDNIDTKYMSLNNNGYAWFEKNKLDDLRIKTTRLMIFLRNSNEITECIDASRDEILNMINHALSLKNKLICYVKSSKNAKRNIDGDIYYDELCYLKYDWIKQYYPNIIKSLPLNITQKFKAAFYKLLKMPDDKMQRYINEFMQ